MNSSRDGLETLGSTLPQSSRAATDSAVVMAAPSSMACNAGFVPVASWSISSSMRSISSGWWRGVPSITARSCEFRTEFKAELKDLFRQLARIAITLGWLRLEEVALDGTRVQANNARDQTWTAEKVRQAAEALAAQWGQALEETERADADDLQSPVAVPPELADARVRHQLLQEVLAQLQAADEARRKDGIDPDEEACSGAQQRSGLQGHAKQGRRLPPRTTRRWRPRTRTAATSWTRR